MSDHLDKARPNAAARAEAARLRAESGAAATADYLAETKAVDERTARLRALRLERDREAAANAAPQTAPKRVARKKVKRVG